MGGEARCCGRLKKSGPSQLLLPQCRYCCRREDLRRLRSLERCLACTTWRTRLFSCEDRRCSFDGSRCLLLYQGKYSSWLNHCYLMLFLTASCWRVHEVGRRGVFDSLDGWGRLGDWGFSHCRGTWGRNSRLFGDRILVIGHSRSLSGRGRLGLFGTFLLFLRPICGWLLCLLLRLLLIMCAMLLLRGLLNKLLLHVHCEGPLVVL